MTIGRKRRQGQRTNRPIKVLHLIGQTGLGGAERQLTYFLQHSDWTRFHHEVVVLNSREPFTLDESIEETGSTIHQISKSCRGARRRMQEIVRLCRTVSPSVLHSWSFYANPYVGLGGRWAAVPVLLGSMRNDPDSPAIKKMTWPHRGLAYRSVHGLITNSQNAREQLLAQGLSRQQIFLVKNAVQTEKPSAEKVKNVLEEFGIGPDVPVVGTVGNLRRLKNHLMFIEAMAEVCNAHRDAHAVIVGRESSDEPELRKQLEDRIAELDLNGRIIVTGVREDVPALMRRFSVFCLTSEREGMPNVVLEAMAAGCPVVSTRVGDVETVLADGETGFLIEQQDEHALANRVLRLLGDRKLAISLGELGQRRVEADFGLERMAREFEGVYLQMLKHRGFRFNTV